MQIIHYFIPVLFCAFTGWFTAWLMLRMMFRPLHKKQLPGGLSNQGVLPKNQPILAEKAGKLAESLFSFELIEEKITSPETLEKLKPEIEMHIDHFLREKLKTSFPMLSVFIGEKTINQLKSAFLAEVESLFPVLMKNYIGNLKVDIDIAKTVTEKLNALSIPEMETLLRQNARKELFLFKAAGALTGILAGLLQLVIMHVLN